MQASKKKVVEAALIFHSTRNDNLGVGALTVSSISIMRELAEEVGIDLKFNVVDAAGARASYVSGPDVVVSERRELRQPASIFRLFRAADIVVDIGGGDSFSDIYGAKRLVRLLLLKYLALLARRPLVLAPQTVGPFRSGIWLRLSLPAIRRSALVATRDDLSTRYLRQMGLRGEIVEASDVALKLPFTPPGNGTRQGLARVGLNVSGLLMNGGYSGANMFGLKADYPRLVRTLVERFLAHPETGELHLVPHVISTQRGATEDDYAAALALAGEFPDVTVAPAFATPSEAKSYIAGMDFFMGARMHSCIAAFSAGVPVIPMAYSRKFAGLFGSLGYDHTVDCTTETEGAIVTAVLSGFEARAELARNVAAARRRGLERLGAYEAALGALLRRVSRA